MEIKNVENAIFAHFYFFIIIYAFLSRDDDNTRRVN